MINNCCNIAGNINTDQLINDSENVNITKNSDDDIKIQVLRHEIIKDGSIHAGKGVFITIKNISEFDIAEALFEAIFYNTAGETIDNVNYSSCDIKRGEIRKIKIVTLRDIIQIMKYSIKLLKIIPIPVPTAIGNNEIQILEHSLQKVEEFSSGQRPETSINVAIKNISEKTVSTAIFEIIMLDGSGIILDKIVHKELYIKSQNGRRFNVVTKSDIWNKVKSYKIRVIKTITADIEKVQICSQRIRTNDNGEEEFGGLIRNISDVKTDTAVVATFKDRLDDVIGIIVLPVKNIEPGKVKKFDFIYTNPSRGHINSFRLDVGDILEPIEANI